MVPIETWTMRKRPSVQELSGRFVRLERFDETAHGEDLWAAFGGRDTNERLFHFGWPPMEDWRDLARMLSGLNRTGDYITFAFCDPATGQAQGMASLMHIVEMHGSIEVGAVAHGAQLARSPAATQAHYLLARHIFDDLGYRRYEWKLNNANTASHAAAKRLGFQFEGVFRQHMVMPYGNRDTAWYSMIDSEWPQAKAAFEAWLAPDNFNPDGSQKRRLEEIREKRS